MLHTCLKFLTCLLLCAWSFVAANAMSAERTLGPGGPPLAYQLDEVSVRVQRQFGHGRPTQLISLIGKGSATLERGAHKQVFDYPAKDLLAVLNELYKIQFFEMPATMRPKYSVFLKNDGSIGTQASHMSDAGSTKFCFTLPGYEKCVSYGADGPRELEDLVRRLFAEADKLAESVGYAK